MKVVLLDNIRKLGHIGDVKNVSDGFARNYLIPKKLAKPAHSNIEKEIEALKEKAKVVTAKNIENANEMKEALAEFVLEMTVVANNEGVLYAALSTQEISKALKEKGFKIAQDDIKTETPIKSVGEHNLTLELGEDVTAGIKLHVQS